MERHADSLRKHTCDAVADVASAKAAASALDGFDVVAVTDCEFAALDEALDDMANPGVVDGRQSIECHDGIPNERLTELFEDDDQRYTSGEWLDSETRDQLEGLDYPRSVDPVDIVANVFEINTFLFILVYIRYGQHRRRC